MTIASRILSVAHMAPLSETALSSTHDFCVIKSHLPNAGKGPELPFRVLPKIINILMGQKSSTEMNCSDGGKPWRCCYSVPAFSGIPDGCVCPQMLQRRTCSKKKGDHISEPSHGQARAIPRKWSINKKIHKTQQTCCNVPITRFSEPSRLET